VSGAALKLGATYFPFQFGKYQHLGLKGEYRKHWVSIDNNGKVPIDTSLSTYYFGITYLFDSRTETDSNRTAEEVVKIESNEKRDR
jgi:hypothetical protein